MNIQKINMIASLIHGLSLAGVIVGLSMLSMNISMISLMIFCFSGNISTVTSIQEKLQKAKIIEDLLKAGVFDEVLDVPEEAVERLKQ